MADEAPTDRLCAEEAEVEQSGLIRTEAVLRKLEPKKHRWMQKTDRFRPLEIKKGRASVLGKMRRGRVMRQKGAITGMGN
jgi:hypothetical protein